jgi:hypothetical protein
MLSTPSDWKAPQRLANVGFDGVFVTNGPGGNGDETAEARANPITLRVVKNEFNEFNILFKSDGATAFTPMGSNPFDGALIFGPAGNLIDIFCDARKAIMDPDGSGTGDHVIDYDYVDFSLPGDGDCDGDRDVDLLDFAEFQVCFSGEGGGVSMGCECADLDGDDDVDLEDCGDFEDVLTGPG